MQERGNLEALKKKAKDLEAPELKLLSQEFQSLPPHDVADILESLESGLHVPMLLEMDAEFAGEVLVELNEEIQEVLVPRMPAEELARILETLQPDDAADIYALVDEPLRPNLLRLLPEDLRLQILHLASYHQESAGGIMTPEFLAVSEDTSLAEILEKVRGFEDLETDQVYVVDEDQKLCGVLSLQEILVETDQSQPAATIMERQVASVRDTDDQEEALHQASHYGLSTVPVIDERDHIVGIVTADDLDEVQEEEASEDILRMAGTLAKHPTHLPTLDRILYRLPQLAITTVTCLVIALIIDLLVPVDGKQNLRLEALKYLPLIIALSGNVGTVVNVLVVRGLATQDLDPTSLIGPFFEEFKVGIGIGFLSSSLTLVAVGLMEGWNSLAWAVPLALLFAPIVSGVAGFMIPVIANRLGRDPALSGPLVTNINDLAGTSVYVLICLSILQ
jgi:magnesium transporter